MRVLAIVASHRKNGNTASVARLLGQELLATGAVAGDPVEMDTVFLSDLDSDGVILATPVYVNDVSGAMKTLIDRLAFVCHRPDFARTAFRRVATTGSSLTLGRLVGGVLERIFAG